MALPSQTTRPSPRGRSMSRRQRRRWPALAVLFTGLLMVGGTIWILDDDDTADDDAPGSAVANANEDDGDDAAKDAALASNGAGASGSQTPDRPNLTAAVTSRLPAALPAAEPTRAVTPPNSALDGRPTVEMGGTNGTLNPHASHTPERAKLDPPVTPNPEPDRAAPPGPPVTPRLEERPDPVRTQPNASNAPSSSANTSTTTAARVQTLMDRGMRLLAENQPIEARRTLSQALLTGEVSETDHRRIRDRLTELNERIVFGKELVPNDPFARTYTIQSGDTLSKIVSRENLSIDWRLLSTVNRVDPRRIQVGQRIKLVTGPFHAIVDKSDYRLDLYQGGTDNLVYVRSFTVGLGEYDSTPVGAFRVRPNSKLINPEWVNPRTRERFEPNDSKNPIGEHWIGLEPVDEHLQDVVGYGVHGTIDPGSIGQQRSMGCIRMAAEDVELVYYLLTEGTSGVRIQE